MKFDLKKFLMFNVIIIGLLMCRTSVTYAASQNITAESSSNSINSSLGRNVELSDQSSSVKSSSMSSSNLGVSDSTSFSKKNTESSSSTGYTNSNSTSTSPSTSKNLNNDYFVAGSRSDLHKVATFKSSLPDIYPTDSNRPALDFIDISSHNGDISVAQFKKMKSYGINGVVVKLTESTSYINEKAEAQIANAKSAGLKVSAYHYSWFTTTAEAIKEADYFVNEAKKLGLSKSTLMVNDLEEGNVVNYSNNTANSLAFQNELKKSGYTNVYHYVSQSLVKYGQINAAKLGNKHFWIAQYLYADKLVPGYNTAYGAWQWSPQLKISGVSGYLDISADYTGAFTESPGPWLKKSGYATVVKKYNMYSNFGWNVSVEAADNYEKTYRINGMYHHSNGSTYYSLYGGSSGKWYGYINANAVKVSSNLTKQGAAMPASGYATVVNNYDIWGNFNWKKNLSAVQAYEKTYQIKYKYSYCDGRIFYSLYDYNGVWIGYINAKGVKVVPNAQGAAIPTSIYATVTKHNYNAWNNFNWNKINVAAANVYQKTYRIKYTYHHLNGKTYYSLYDNNNKWVGYVTSTGMTVSKYAQGVVLKTTSQVKVVKHNYGVWTNFSWKEHSIMPKNAYGKVYQAKYYYNHINGKTYYSLYSDNQWLGYISALGTKVVN